MAKILIIDDNPSIGALLKKALEHEDHLGTVVSGAEHAFAFSRHEEPDLILINHFCRRNTGWILFNHIKQVHDTIPVMVYALEAGLLVGLAWIVKAAQEALARIPNPAPLNCSVS